MTDERTQLAFDRAGRLAIAVTGALDDAWLNAELEAMIQRYEVRTADESTELVMQLQWIIRHLAEDVARRANAPEPLLDIVASWAITNAVAAAAKSQRLTWDPINAARQGRT